MSKVDTYMDNDIHLLVHVHARMMKRFAVCSVERLTTVDVQRRVCDRS